MILYYDKLILSSKIRKLFIPLLVLKRSRGLLKCKFCAFWPHVNIFYEIDEEFGKKFELAPQLPACVANIKVRHARPSFWSTLTYKLAN